MLLLELDMWRGWKLNVLNFLSVSKVLTSIMIPNFCHITIKHNILLGRLSVLTGSYYNNSQFIAQDKSGPAKRKLRQDKVQEGVKYETTTVLRCFHCPQTLPGYFPVLGVCVWQHTEQCQPRIVTAAMACFIDASFCRFSSKIIFSLKVKWYMTQNLDFEP